MQGATCLLSCDGEGARGIEQMEDHWLAGKAQRVAVERDARGRLLAFADYDPASSAGGDVALTLDAALQLIAAKAEKGPAKKRTAKKKPKAKKAAKKKKE